MDKKAYLKTIDDVIAKGPYSADWSSLTDMELPGSQRPSSVFSFTGGCSVFRPLQCGDFYWPSLQEQPDQADMFATPYPFEEFLEDWLLRTCELIDNYRPRILYFDWWIQHESYKDTLKKITAYYYNHGVEWGTPVAICYKLTDFPVVVKVKTN